MKTLAGAAEKPVGCEDEVPVGGIPSGSATHVTSDFARFQADKSTAISRGVYHHKARSATPIR
jgi:hypothetical protein